MGFCALGVGVLEREDVNSKAVYGESQSVGSVGLEEREPILTKGGGENQIYKEKLQWLLTTVPWFQPL